MILCYDFQKRTTISLTSIAISLIVGLGLMQYAHGITEEERQANREKYAGLIEEDIKKQDNGTTTGCIDHNLCGTPSPEFADRRKVQSVTPAPDPFDVQNIFIVFCLLGFPFLEFFEFFLFLA